MKSNILLKNSIDLYKRKDQGESNLPDQGKDITEIEAIIPVMIDVYKPLDLWEKVNTLEKMELQLPLSKKKENSQTC